MDLHPLSDSPLEQCFASGWRTEWEVYYFNNDPCILGGYGIYCTKTSRPTAPADTLLDVCERLVPPGAVAVHIIADNFPWRQEKLPGIVWTVTAPGGTSRSRTSNTVPAGAVGREGLVHYFPYWWPVTMEIWAGSRAFSLQAAILDSKLLSIAWVWVSNLLSGEGWSHDARTLGIFETKMAVP